jgi:hypothetical protein
MRIALLRVGIDSGSGGMQGPLFADGTFELVPIPDGFGLDERTYGNHVGRTGRLPIEFFPPGRRAAMSGISMHVDPEFESFTYGDPTQPKCGLRKLSAGDLLVFYCGLQGWDCPGDPALYLCGYFEVELAVLASELGEVALERIFGRNFHVRHPAVLQQQRDRLVLVKGSANSRLLKKAVCISELSADVRGQPLKVLSRRMRPIFGDFGGHVSIQRSPPRWVAPERVEGAAAFVRSLD